MSDCCDNTACEKPLTPKPTALHAEEGPGLFRVPAMDCAVEERVGRDSCKIRRKAVKYLI